MHIVKLGAKWCGPCQHVAKYFEQLQAEFPDVKSSSFDIDESEVQNTYVDPFEIDQIPAFLLLDNSGNLLKKIVGVHNEKLRKLFIKAQEFNSTE